MTMRSLFLSATLLLLLLLPSAAFAQAQARVTSIVAVKNHAPVTLRLHVACRDTVYYDLQTVQLDVTDNGLPVGNLSIRNSASPQTRKPFKAMLVLDGSGSMQGAGNAGLKAAARAMVQFMDPTVDSIGIISFNSVATLRMPLTADTTGLLAIIDSFSASGATAVWDATYMGVQRMVALTDTMSHAVVVMTDGMDNSSTRSLSEIIALANAHNKRVFTIGLGSTINSSQLQSIAALTGGQYFQTPDPATLASIFLQIASLMRRDYDEYTVRFDTPDRQSDRHTLAVTVRVCDTVVTTTATGISTADAAPICTITAPDILRYTLEKDSFDPNPFTLSYAVRNSLDIELTDIEAELDLANAPHLRPVAGEMTSKQLPSIAPQGSASLDWTLEVVSTPPATVVERIAVRYRQEGDSSWRRVERDITIGGGVRAARAGCASVGHDTLWADAAYETVIPQPLQVQHTITNTGDVPLSGCTAAIVHSPAYTLLVPADSVQTYGLLPPGASASREWLLTVNTDLAKPGMDTISWVWGCDGMQADTSCAHEVTLLVASPTGMVFSPWLLRFRAERNGALPPAQTVHVWTGGRARTPWMFVGLDMRFGLDTQPDMGDTSAVIALRPVTTALAEGVRVSRLRPLTTWGAVSPQELHAVYEITASTAVAPPAIPQSAMLVGSYPQPASGVTTIAYTLERAGWTEITLCDMLGRRVATLLAGQCSAGSGSVSFDARSFAPGLYVATLASGGLVESRALMVRR